MISNGLSADLARTWQRASIMLGMAGVLYLMAMSAGGLPLYSALELAAVREELAELKADRR